jgi:hypothetical protein
MEAVLCPNTASLEITANGISIERHESSPYERIQRLIQHAKLPSIVKQQFMRKLPDLMVNPLNIFDIAHTFTRSQLLAIYESLVPANLDRLAEEVNTAFEDMLVSLRKLGVG